MPWPVYTERFYVAGGNAGSGAFVVPAGRRYIVRSILCVGAGNAVSDFYMSLPGITVFFTRIPVNEFAKNFELVAAFYAGETVTVSRAANGTAITISGYSLQTAAMQSDEPPDQLELPFARGPQPPAEALE